MTKVVCDFCGGEITRENPTRYELESQPVLNSVERVSITCFVVASKDICSECAYDALKTMIGEPQ